MSMTGKLKPIIIASLFTCGAGAVLGWMLLQIDSMGALLRTSLQAIANERVIDTQYNELVSTLERTEDERQLLERFILSDEADTIVFLSELDEAARRLGVSFTTGALNTIDEEGAVDTLAATFNIHGTEAAFLRMVEIFETLPYHGSIDSVTFSRTANPSTGTTDVTGSITVSLSIRDYD